MTLESGKGSARPFFAIYKPGQGKYVRWGTVAAMALVVGAGMWWLGDRVLKAYSLPLTVVAPSVMVFGAIGAFITFLLVNRPRPAEFMIMTESEMRKVTWPTRQAVLNSTKVVIFLTFLMAIMLFVVDWGFVRIFEWMRILKD